jgi:hypothetical protein
MANYGGLTMCVFWNTLVQVRVGHLVQVGVKGVLSAETFWPEILNRTSSAQKFRGSNFQNFLEDLQHVLFYSENTVLFVYIRPV